MKIGERIRKYRQEKGISVETMAKMLQVSHTTVYRYEDASIEKIPFDVFNRICEILDVTPGELLGHERKKKEEHKPLPAAFDNAQDAMEFILKTPTIAAFGEYDPKKMSEETMVAFANDILQQLKLVSFKYKGKKR